MQAQNFYQLLPCHHLFLQQHINSAVQGTSAGFQDGLQQGVGHLAAASGTAGYTSPCRAHKVGTCGCSTECPYPSDLTLILGGAMGRRGSWSRLHRQWD